MTEKFIDGTKLSAEEIVRYMNYDCIRYCGKTYLKYGISKFYCGITCDIYDNYNRHKSIDFHGDDFEYICIYKCKDADTAAEVESLLREEGYDCGATLTFGNGGNEDSIFVYMFRKP